MVNFCAGFGMLMSVIAVILLIFTQIGQISTSTVPRHLRIVVIETGGLANAIGEATNNGPANLTSLYAKNNIPYFTKDPSGTGPNTGLRNTYEFGLWNYCAKNGDAGSSPQYCTSRGFGSTIQPAVVLIQDAPAEFATAIQTVLPDNVFTADDYLGRFTKAATYLIFVGTLLAAIVMLIGLFAKRGAFFLGSLLAILSTLCLGIGATIYSVIVSRVKQAINDASYQDVNVGIEVEYGNAIWLLWTAVACMLLSIVPLAIACCTGRSTKPDSSAASIASSKQSLMKERR